MAGDLRQSHIVNQDIQWMADTDPALIASPSLLEGDGDLPTELGAGGQALLGFQEDQIACSVRRPRWRTVL